MPDESDRNKAVAEGAISFFVEHYVTVRIAKFTYGSEAAIPFDLTNPEHALRTSKAQLGIAGNLVLPNAFYPLLTKVILHLYIIFGYKDLLHSGKPHSGGRRAVPRHVSQRVFPSASQSHRCGYHLL